MSKVLGFSLHQSGRMLLVIYENNMMRLWNLLDGRCSFKQKKGLDEDEKVAYRVHSIKWEPEEGLNYALLYDRKLEVY